MFLQSNFELVTWEISYSGSLSIITNGNRDLDQLKKVLDVMSLSIDI